MIPYLTINEFIDHWCGVFDGFSDATLLVRGCNQLGQFLSHRETNLRYLALESLCLLATSEFSHESVKKHQETVINALKVQFHSLLSMYSILQKNPNAVVDLSTKK